MRRNRALLLASVAAFGLGLASPSFGADRAEIRREAALKADGSNNRLSYETLPPNVREALDRERAGRKVVSVYRADRGDRSWYSVVVELRRGGNRVIRVSPRGAILGVGDLTVEEVKVFKESPDRWYKSYSDTQSGRETFYAKGLDRVTATGDHPEHVEWDGIPARIRAVILRENLGAKPENWIVRYREKDEVVYQVNLKDGPGREHMIKIQPDGTIFEEGDFDGKGKFLPNVVHPKTVLSEDLPRAVRDTVDREAPRGKVSHIDIFNRNGRDVYTVEVDLRTSSRYITVSQDGKVLSDITDTY